MSARISADPRERTLIAGARMGAGTIAGVVVALGTVPLGRWLAGGEGARGYAAAAAAFAGFASLILLAVAGSFRDAIPPAPRPTRASPILLVWRDRAFVWFAAATVAMIVPVTMIDRSVLYYFRYDLHDPGGGRLTLGAMMAVNGFAIPAWLALSRRLGPRGVWAAAIAICLSALLAFVVLDPRSPGAVRAFLLVMQVGTIGLGFAMWALLPELLDQRRRAGAGDAEAVAYGWLALIQRVAIGLGTLLLGLGFGRGGVGAGTGWLRASLSLVPLGFLLMSGLLMLGAGGLRRRTPA